ncbi:uncharacterized protein CANTADRAFT_3999 [Suhomyces tanzawaensis NRRL Y-17324]|uniref:Uncharacterized protein n=1 Tax=Suhomyces tanzawaensis NRRL Y-17324 TaxID=984487 RepID=A0A1E4SR20_9ASCO|nr:uncharacterized protein CANTADRAFT_3999 [Suhomyces tanzawaensis NRRL Y-17324]ODV81945.1 hypothetical protein CANTADRAFT_3999 [Suhomyces tanzawaensis NRRL Y-17324]
MSRESVSTTITQAPEDFNSVGAPVKLKTPLKKEELEKIAKQLKKKLSKASITAKQSFSPGKMVASSVALPKSSPLKSYALKKLLGSSPIGAGLLSSSPNNLYSPNGKSPTHIRTPAAIYLSSSPLKNIAADDTEEETMDSPTKRRKSSPLKEKAPQMILEEISRPNTPSKQFPAALKPSLELTASKSENKHKESPQQTTPTLLKRELSVNTTPNVLLKTPTQPRPSANDSGAYNDEEGADLLMYLATSPSPAKPFFSNTPRAINIHHPINSSAPTSAGSFPISHKPTASTGSTGSFIAPPPVTPKRHGNTSTRTPQNRLTPSMNLFSNLINGNLGLPSSGLTLTPTGFNMNDYVNFFTPSPGGANIHSAQNKNLLRTPDFNNLINNANSASANSENVANGLLGKPKVDGKILNFNKVLFGNGPGSETPKE